MVKPLILFVPLLLVTWSVLAKGYETIGWHWYNEPAKIKSKKANDGLMRTFQRLSPEDQLKLLQRVTRNLKDKAVLSGKVSDITAYKRAQDFWVNRATQFTVGWEKMLLEHPELNYALQFSNENALAPIQQRAKHAREKEAVLNLAATNGLLFFYRGGNKEDALFSKIVSRYAHEYHWALIPVTVDGVLSPAFHHSWQTGGLAKAHALGVRYFPTLVLVNPTSHQTAIVSYGFKSEEELSDRLLKVADGWKAEF